LQAEGIPAWDRWLMPVVGLYGPLATLVVAGLDQRFQWSPSLPVSLQHMALAGVVLGYALAVWALLVNRFFSAVVRIQRDRGHFVITSGPYRCIRHPGYAGGLIASLMVPLLLTSLWALVPAGLTSIAIILRTLLEDRTLQHDLPGYKEYAQHTRFRLVPRIW
jgi:protein-S-isoprenylcysteine O-methyltransferase Ste14